MDTDTHTGRMPCERYGRDWAGTSKNQETQKIANKPSGASQEAQKRFFLTAHRRNQHCQHPRLPASRIVR